MVAQVIFFSALVLFIILLGRKANILERIKPFLLQLTKSTWGALATIGQQAARQAGSLRTGKNKVFGPSQSVNQQQSEPNFWGEELPESKHELPSYFEEGDNLLKAGKFEQAEQFFLRAASRHPNDPKIYARLGLMYLNNKNYSDAIESLKVATKLDRYNPSRHYNLALSYWGNKDIQKAIMSVREAISLDPVTPKYRQLLEQLLNG